MSRSLDKTVVKSQDEGDSVPHKHADTESLARFPDENPHPVMRIGTDGIVLYANDAAGPVLDQMNVAMGACVPVDVLFAVEDAASSGDPQHLIISSGGVEYALTLYPVRGRDYLNVFGRDVTWERQTERRIRDLSRFPDENPNPILRISDELVVLYANDPSRAILAAWGISIGEQIPEEIRERVRSGFRAERSVYLEVRFGATIYALQVSPVAGVGYANAYGRDVTRLRRAEQELVEANLILAAKNDELELKNVVLERAGQLKDEFLANTSHELRTPLNGIVGITESLLDGAAGPLNAHVRENLSLVVKSGRRLARLVNDILDFSKLQNRSLDLNRCAVDLRTACDVVLFLSRPLAEPKSIQTVNSIPVEFGAVLADEDRLQQVLHNLIGNAIKFSEGGSVEVSAREFDDEAGRRWASVTVSDDGIGVPPDLQEKIFESFEQGDGTVARDYGGTGLGLSVTRALVELHGGEISVESDGVQGAIFTFTIPTATAEDRELRGTANPGSEGRLQHLSYTVPASIDDIDGPEPAVEMEAHLIDYSVASGERVDVLLVDDDPVNLRVLRNHLAPRGYTCHDAENGPDALALLAGGLRPDLVLLDVMMPKMSGFEVCRALRELYPAHEVPVVLVTARTQVADLIDGLKSGANDYLTKPISKNELLARLKTHLENARMSVAAGRFVPREFLKILGHSSLLDVSRGDHMEKEMSILFSDIRSFTTLVEGRTPQQNFAFINEYLGHMEPPILRNHGFIDSYEGDAIMALFEGKADDAVAAGIGDLQALTELNIVRSGRGDRELKIGIGVNTGRLMLGTIGGLDRIKCGVIGDPVNLAARIETMTKFYGASFLISEHTYAALREPDAIATRAVDRVIAKGKTKPVTVYEVLDGLPDDERGRKLEARDAFDEAWSLFQQGTMDHALARFETVAAAVPEDTAAKLYVDRCQTYLRDGVPADWTGVVTLQEK